VVGRDGGGLYVGLGGLFFVYPAAGESDKFAGAREGDVITVEGVVRKYVGEGNRLQITLDGGTFHGARKK
jgi:hypothetical protein